MEVQSYFNPRSPRGERLEHLSIGSRELGISIHAPREGSDLLMIMIMFLLFMISIHAPREGSDTFSDCILMI